MFLLLLRNEIMVINSNCNNLIILNFLQLLLVKMVKIIIHFMNISVIIFCLQREFLENIYVCLRLTLPASSGFFL
jgi:hypothetical protein